jgi:hypothetical protein
MMTEIGSAEEGGSKAAWIQDAVGVQIPTRYPAVKGLVWWNKYESSRPWPIQSSPSAQAAFASAIASPYYAPAAFSQLSASPVPAP